MFYGETIEETRLLFYQSWQKFNQKKPLSPLESILVGVIQLHPTYHDFLLDSSSLSSSKFASKEENPFLHLGLHVTIREQVSMNRPQGIRDIYQALIQQYGDTHEAEHALMEPLMHVLYEAQCQQSIPDEILYLQSCQKLLRVYTK